ncbi:Borrelia ORF-A-containing protein (plasmid) [Borrelia crocidurae str. Achema]|uniref:Borrelia ORF-A-containing protein n=1 Tax=Borrelia crocidurae (strain Achema) TaxID=1155096 RepID=I0FES5_BORCA|nr:Borrelia ORF-A-containing protein [Borrelia crocidurae str. Achema]
MGLIKSKIRKLGEQKGSIAYYVQNMELAHVHKDIILKYLIQLLTENLYDKKIIGDFDADIKNTTFNYTNLETFGILFKFKECKSLIEISHVERPDVINKTNISNINKKNSKNSIETNSLKNPLCKKQKSEKVQFK